MKIQLDIPQDLNKKLKVEKAEKEHKSIAEVIIKILREYFKNGHHKTDKED